MRIYIIFVMMCLVCVVFGSGFKQPMKMYAILAYTGSMEPTYHGGEILEIYPSDGIVENGQVIIYQHCSLFDCNYEYTMHRVLMQPFGCIITKGDALIIPDSTCQTPVYELV